MKTSQTELEVAFIDNEGKVEISESLKSLNKDSLHFDFNSKEDFSPDNDSSKVALKFWTWLLNPLPFSEFS